MARERLERNALAGCSMVQGSIFDPPFEERSIELVVCCDLLGHLREAPAAAEALAQTLKPGGVLIANLFAEDDSTRLTQEVEVAPGQYLYGPDQLYYRYYERVEADQFARALSLDLVHFSKVDWEEPPHQGFREYAHTHASWLLVFRRSIT
jgi:SAM-dependent methyltransferase